MLCELLERGTRHIPGLYEFYRKRAAMLKQNYCLTLHRFGMLKPFSFVMWLATNQCNFSCPFCEASAGSASADELTGAEATKLIDDLKGMGVKRLLLSGGEPLIRPDILDVMDYANRSSLELGLITNGWFVEEMQDELKRFRFFLYFTSLDGVPEYNDRMRGMQGAFARTLAGLEIFGRLQVPLRLVNTVVHPGNIAQLEEMLGIVKNSAANWWRLTPVTHVGRAADKAGYELSGEHLSYLANFIKENRTALRIDFGESHAYMGCLAGIPGAMPFFCGAGLTRCSIMPNGDVLGCQQVFDVSYSEGNIREKSFPQIWKEGFTRFRNKELRTVCLDCVHLAGCRGGCWAEMEKRGSCLKAVWDERK